MPEKSATRVLVSVPEAAPSRPAIRQVFAKLPAHDVERARAFYRQTFDLGACRRSV
jgi:hypothetical protein